MPRKHKGSRKHKRKSHRGGNILESGEDLVKELMKMIGAGQSGGNLSTYPSPLSYPIPLAMLGDTYSIRQGMDLTIGT